jgi:hypothetical protein
VVPHGQVHSLRTIKDASPLGIAKGRKVTESRLGRTDGEAEVMKMEVREVVQSQAPISL